jgi:hypothetical protein
VDSFDWSGKKKKVLKRMTTLLQQWWWMCCWCWWWRGSILIDFDRKIIRLIYK